MTCLAESNWNAAEIKEYPCLLPVSSAEPSTQKVKNVFPKFVAASRSGVPTVNPDELVWLELSFVPAIERVYVSKQGDVFDVLIVVNERDPKGRREIYAREKAIIDALPGYGFNFDILARMNIELKDLLTDSEKPAYIRRP
jgi:hypothetical protein